MNTALRRRWPKGRYPNEVRAVVRANGMGISLPNTATAQELFNSCKAHGGAGWDHSAMVRALEIMAKHEVK